MSDIDPFLSITGSKGKLQNLLSKKKKKILILKLILLPFFETLLFCCARVPVQGSRNTTDPVLRRGFGLHDIRKRKARGGDGDIVAWVEFDSKLNYAAAPPPLVSIYLSFICWGGR